MLPLLYQKEMWHFLFSWQRKFITCCFLIDVVGCRHGVCSSSLFIHYMLFKIVWKRTSFRLLAWKKYMNFLFFSCNLMLFFFAFFLLEISSLLAWYINIIFEIHIVLEPPFGHWQLKLFFDWSSRKMSHWLVQITITIECDPNPIGWLWVVVLH